MKKFIAIPILLGSILVYYACNHANPAKRTFTMHFAIAQRPTVPAPLSRLMFMNGSLRAMTAF